MKMIYQGLYKISMMLLPVLSKANIVPARKDSKCVKIIESYPRKELYNKDTFLDAPIADEEFDLSVIIPVYNSEKYLKKCLDSICNQITRYKYQIICVNDGSTDDSLEILNEYQKKYGNLYIITQKNGGISNARNNGIRAASGAYLGFIDNDDWVTKDYVEKLLDRAYKTSADIVKCNHVNYSAESNSITGVIRHDDASISQFGLNIMDFKGYIWGGIIRKTLFSDIRFPEGYWYEDIMMRFTLMKIAKRFEFIDENLYYYYLHKTNSSKTLWKKDDLKTLDFYYLLNDLCKINNELGIASDGVFYNQLVYELGPNLWLRTRKMSKKFRKTLFVYAAEMGRQYYNGSFKSFYGVNNYISDALLHDNYLLWAIASFNVICNVHIGYVK